MNKKFFCFLFFLNFCNSEGVYIITDAKEVPKVPRKKLEDVSLGSNEDAIRINDLEMYDGNPVQLFDSLSDIFGILFRIEGKLANIYDTFDFTKREDIVEVSLALVDKVLHLTGIGIDDFVNHIACLGRSKLYELVSVIRTFDNARYLKKYPKSFIDGIDRANVILGSLGEQMSGSSMIRLGVLDVNFCDLDSLTTVVLTLKTPSFREIKRNTIFDLLCHFTCPKKHIFRFGMPVRLMREIINLLRCHDVRLRLYDGSGSGESRLLNAIHHAKIIFEEDELEKFRENQALMAKYIDVLQKRETLSSTSHLGQKIVLQIYRWLKISNIEQNSYRRSIPFLVKYGKILRRKTARVLDIFSLDPVVMAAEGILLFEKLGTSFRTDFAECLRQIKEKIEDSSPETPQSVVNACNVIKKANTWDDIYFKSSVEIFDAIKAVARAKSLPDYDALQEMKRRISLLPADLYELGDFPEHYALFLRNALSLDLREGNPFDYDVYGVKVVDELKRFAVIAEEGAELVEDISFLKFLSLILHNYSTFYIQEYNIDSVRLFLPPDLENLYPVIAFFWLASATENANFFCRYKYYVTENDMGVDYPDKRTAVMIRKLIKC